MPWDNPEGLSGEGSDPEFTFLSDLARNLPDDSSEDEDPEGETDPRYLRAKRLMKALLDSEDSEGSKDYDDMEDYESDDKNGSQENAFGIKAFCQVFMTDTLTSSTSSVAKAPTNGLTLEGKREEVETGPTFQDANEREDWDRDF